MITVNRVTNANVYLDGENQLGRAEEVTLPTIKIKSAEHKALGMVGSLELPSGVDKLESKFKWNSFYRSIFLAMANPYKFASIQVRANVELYAGEGREGEVPLVVYLRGNFKELPLGALKQHDNAEFESTFNVTYVKVELDGEELLEYDVLNNIYKVGGEDILATYRTNVGG